MKILVVEDNIRLAERISAKLHKSHSIDRAETGHEVLDRIKQVEYSVIILDLGLPDMSGLEVCQRLRKLSVTTPILILTGKDEMSERIELLNQGADDFMTKPFDPNELRARISALGRRRSRQPPTSQLQYKDIIIDIEERKVSRSGVNIELRRKEFDILEYLIRNKGRVLTRDMIMNHAWDADKTSWSSTVDVHIKHIRDKIDRPFAVPIIKTAYGLGYRVDSAQ
jgi:two-component system response regulator ArlR